MVDTVAPPDSQAGDIAIRLAGIGFGDPGYFVFPVGLEGLSISYGTRASVTQALDAFWVDSLGPAVVNFTLVGHTGYRRQPRLGNLDGRGQFLKMLKIHKEHQARMRAAPNQFTSLLLFADPSSGFIFWCFANNLTITRDRGAALLFHFEWQLTVVKDISNYVASGQIVPSLSNTGGGGR